MTQIGRKIDFVEVSRFERSPMEDHFNDIYRNGGWGIGSGEGSYLQNTGPYRSYLSDFLRTHSVRSVVDLGCGDWQSSAAIDWRGIRYMGFDCVKSVVERNRAAFARKGIEFRHYDFSFGEGIPRADLAIVKDVFQHWTNQQILSFLPCLQRFKFVLITNCRPTVNEDIERAGQFRPLDISLEPFNIPISSCFDWYTKRTQLWKPHDSTRAIQVSMGNMPVPSKEIPRIVHQTWKNAMLPRHVEHCCRTVRELNPEWEYRFYTDDRMEEIIEELSQASGSFDRPSVDEFRSVPTGITKSDIFRCAALYLHGGIYCDIDIEAIRPFAALLDAAARRGLMEGSEVLLTTDHPLHCIRIYRQKVLMNHFMIARPKARFFEAYLAGAAQLIRSGGLGGNPVLTTGPIAFTELVARLGGSRKAGIAIMPSAWINPLPNMVLSFTEVAAYDKLIRQRAWRQKLRPFVAHYWWHNYSNSDCLFTRYGDLLFEVETTS